MTASAKPRVFIVDDHPVMREGMARMLESTGEFEVSGQAAERRAAYREVLEDPPDVAVIDVALPGASGLELTRELLVKLPSLRVLIYSMHDESLFAERALNAGARGFLMKSAPFDALLQAVRVVERGDFYLSPEMTQRMLTRAVQGTVPEQEQDPTHRLSNRQLDVFRLIGEGRATKEIADELCVSAKTVESHRANIKAKLRLRSGAELVRYAVQWVQEQSGGSSA